MPDVLYICFSSVNEMTTSGQTSLHLAAESNLSDVCSILLSNGVDYVAVDSRGNNALHLAVKEGHIAVARVLVGFKVKRFQAQSILKEFRCFSHERFSDNRVFSKTSVILSLSSFEYSIN